MIKLFMSLILILICLPSLAGPGKVGNGDDGTDLESFELVKEGPLLKSREKAIELLIGLNTRAIANLGNLLPELKHSKIYLTKKNIGAKKLEELGAYHSGMKGFVYARTFPRPYAATRFFPVSLGLTEKELMALHIHEALHRSLPKNYRENEKIVSEITLAITSEEATYDHVNELVQDLIKNDSNFFLSNNSSSPAFLELSYINFNRPVKQRSHYFSPLGEMYLLSSKVYPFKNKWSSLGMGLDFSFFKSDDQSYIGPLGMLLSGQIETLRGYSLEVYSRWGRDTGSSKEFRNSLSARDSFRVGLKISKDYQNYQLLNQLEFIKGHKQERTFNSTEYHYQYGSITTAKTELLRKGKHWSFGSYLKLVLTGPFEVRGGIDLKTERNTIISLGPKIRWRNNENQVEAFSNLVLTSKASDFNIYGDFLGEGLGQNAFGLKYTFYF